MQEDRILLMVKNLTERLASEGDQPADSLSSTAMRAKFRDALLGHEYSLALAESLALSAKIAYPTEAMTPALMNAAVNMLVTAVLTTTKQLQTHDFHPTPEALLTMLSGQMSFTLE